MGYRFHTETELSKGLKELFDQLQQRLELHAPIKAYIAGGIAVHLYTAYRVSMDVDAEFGARLHLPRDLGIEVPGPNGKPLWLHFDMQYNSTFALMHEDYHQDAHRLPLGVQNFDIYVLSPVDLAVSKIARFAKNDQEDIEALVRHGLTNAQAIEARALDALPGYVGNLGPLKLNIRDAVEIARKAEALQLDGLNSSPAPSAQPDTPKGVPASTPSRPKP